MKYPNLLKTILISIVLSTFGCGSFDGQNKTSEKGGQITTTISVPGNLTVSGEKIITMSIENGTKNDYKFLKWNSPFEETFVADYLNIQDVNGTKTEYHGPMVKRRMPPPEESYATVAAGKSTEVSIDFSKAYTFEKSGKYTIVFEGTYVSDSIPASNKVEFGIK